MMLLSTGDKILHDTVPPKYLFQPENVDYDVTEWTWKSWDESRDKQSKLISNVVS